MNTCNTLIQTFVQYVFLILEPEYLSEVEGVDANFVWSLEISVVL